jgi:hypothetical protein
MSILYLNLDVPLRSNSGHVYFLVLNFYIVHIQSHHLHDLILLNLDQPNFLLLISS